MYICITYKGRKRKNKNVQNYKYTMALIRVKCGSEFRSGEVIACASPY